MGHYCDRPVPGGICAERHRCGARLPAPAERRAALSYIVAALKSVLKRGFLMGYVISPVAAPVLPVGGTADVFPVNRIFCVGRNYADHVREMGGKPEREAPMFFMKPGSATLPEGQDFPYPGHSQDVHHEVELVVAI